MLAALAAAGASKLRLPNSIDSLDRSDPFIQAPPSCQSRRACAITRSSASPIPKFR